MLTSNLLRARVWKGEIRPDYINPEDPELLGLAETLIESFEAHIGRPRHELETELKELLGTGTEFLLQRGLAKLLWDRSEFESPVAIDPFVLRQTVFALAARYRQANAGQINAQEIYRQLASELQMEEAFDVQNMLYADLKEEQHITLFRKVKPEWLLKRYNVALAQAVLFRASELKVRVANQSMMVYRELFRRIKFFQLMYQVHGNAEDGYELELDGPMSLFRSSQKYGVQMANFLPTLLHCTQWQLDATVLWGKAREPRRFSLSHETGLEPYQWLTGQWQPEEMQFLKQRFGKVTTDWILSEETELIDLGGQGVLVPDYVFVHKPTGQRVLMEIFGYWRKGGLAKRLELLKEHGPPNLLLAVSEELHVDEELTEDLPQEVYTFRSIPNTREVAERLDRMLEGKESP